MEDASALAGRGNTLVLSGGGGRGFTHIGVVRALKKLGVPIDVVGGTSMGGILGAVMANGVPPEQLVGWAKRHSPRSLDYTFPVVGLVKARRIVESARETFGDGSIEDLWRSYFAVSTDLTTARVHVHRRGPLDLVIRATSAIPGVMPPVPLGSSLLVDGGVLNNLPIDIARDGSPGGRVIVVDVASPRGRQARSDYGLSVSGWHALRSGMGGRRSPLPRISAVLMRSMITASMGERDDLVRAGLADCYLPLDMRGVSMLDFNDPAGVAASGYGVAMPLLTVWLESRS